MLETTSEKAKLRKNLFDDDLSETGSDSTDLPPETVISSATPSKRRVERGVPATPRPQRSQKVGINYAESDTEEEGDRDRTSPLSTVKGGKRRREPSTESPTKRLRTISGHNPPRRAYSLSGRPQTSKDLHPTMTPLPTSEPRPSRTSSPQKPSLAKGRATLVRLNGDGNPDSETGGGYWWPGKVVDLDGLGQATFQLYGDDGRGPYRKIIIDNSSAENIQSIFLPNGLRRYDEDNFQEGGLVDKNKYKDAVQAAVWDPDVDDDISLAGNDNEDLRSEGSPQPAVSDEQKSKLEWRPPSPTEFLDCIHQRVLCKASPGSTKFWPAKVVGYIAPTKPGEKPRFEIHFFDWKTARLGRECFYIQYDEDREKFATCKLDRRKLGDWVQKNSSIPEEEELEEDIFSFDFSTLPEPMERIPKPQTFLNDMSIEGQFSYIVPFMKKILKEEYSPSQKRVNQWMEGGLSRQAITSNPIQCGHLADLEWHLFGKLVKSWALPLAIGGTTYQTARPIGSERYEALDPKDKGLFIFDVLLGEAVIQLLLLRHGKRTSLTLLEEEEEKQLYELGTRLSNEESTSSLVSIVLKDRERIRAELGLPSEGVDDVNGLQENDTGRRKRAVARSGR